MQTIKFFAILMAAATEMAAESAPTRRLIVNIPARKIALVEDGKVVKVYSVAVGKQSTPSPTRHLPYREPRGEPDLLSRRQGGGAGAVESGGHALDEPGLQGLWHPRNESSRIHWPRGVARVHPHAKSRCGGIV